MIYEFIEGKDTTAIMLDFSDEGTNLQCEISVKGDTAAAAAYLPFFAADMRANFAELFPVPEPEVYVEEPVEEEPVPEPEPEPAAAEEPAAVEEEGGMK